MRLMIGIAAGACLLAACSTPTAGAPSATQTAAAGPHEEKICKRMTATGSNMPQKVCSTQAEWDARDRQGQESVEDMERQRDTAGSTGAPGLN